MCTSYRIIYKETFCPMKTASYEYILKTIQQTNILPVTSYCTTGCIFCSHRNNPLDIEAYRLPDLSADDIANMSEFLDGDKKIVIGESASRIIEGEPFLRDDMADILKFLRQKHRFAPIEITTNGIYLTREIIKSLKEIEPVELNISLNSSSNEGRNRLYTLKDTCAALDAVRYLNESNIKFNGSIVAMPHVVGYGDIEETISFLCRNGAGTVRVFVPGFSGLSSFKIDFFQIRDQLLKIADSLYEKYSVPVLVEPPNITNLEPEVCGVIKGSPAALAGIQKGDVILQVEGYEPLTRVDAYNAIYKKQSPCVQVKRGNNIMDAVIEKGANESSGAVFYYDVDPYSLYDIEKAINRYKSKKPLVVTSELGYNAIVLGVEKLIDDNIDICIVHNSKFKGTIMCAGLLTVNDMVSELSQRCLNNKNDLIILPPIPFDINGRDICGCHFYDIEKALGIRAVIAE